MLEIVFFKHIDQSAQIHYDAGVAFGGLDAVIVT